MKTVWDEGLGGKAIQAFVKFHGSLTTIAHFVPPPGNVIVVAVLEVALQAANAVFAKKQCRKLAKACTDLATVILEYHQQLKVGACLGQDGYRVSACMGQDVCRVRACMGQDVCRGACMHGAGCMQGCVHAWGRMWCVHPPGACCGLG